MSNFYSNIEMHKEQMDETKIRHQILLSLLNFKNKFGRKYGDMIICVDDKVNWRRQFFTEYKDGRRKSRETSDLNWKNIYGALNSIADELDNVFPYKLVKVDTCEADDIIGALCIRYHKSDKILIVSSDKDFQQLQMYKNIEQYSPYHKKLLVPDRGPELHLKELIIKGDKSDGVPNIKSPDNSFVDKIRQKPVTKPWLESLLMTPGDFSGLLTEDEKKYYIRNKKMIDLASIPSDLFDNIITKYETANRPGYSHLINYFQTNQLDILIERINEF